MADNAKLRELHDFLMTLPRERFNMRYLFTGGEQFATGNSNQLMRRLDHQYDTAACVAGLTGYLFAPDDGSWDVSQAEEMLGLDEFQGAALFAPAGYYANPENFTPRGAAKTIRTFLMTGIMRWSEPAHA